MTKEDIKEIIKALAYGKTAENIAAICDVDAAEVKEIEKNYAADIEAKREFLKQEGFL